MVGVGCQWDVQGVIMLENKLTCSYALPSVVLLVVLVVAKIRLPSFGTDNRIVCSHHRPDRDRTCG